MDSSCDIGSRLAESMKQFPYFDYSEITNVTGWYVDFMDEPHRTWVY